MSPSSQPGYLYSNNLPELRDALNFILQDLYAKLDFALHLDGKGVLIELKWGGLGRDVSAFNGLIYLTGGVSGQLALGTGLVFDATTGKLYLNVTTKGDILAGTADQSMARLGIAAIPDGYVLSKGGAHATGLQWIDPTTMGGQYRYAGDVLDDATFNLPAITNGARGVLVVGADEERADFSIKSDGTVNLVMASANVVTNADTDGKFCIGTSVASPVVIKNRLAAPKAVMLQLWYN